MLPLVCSGDQGHASVVAQARLLDLNTLRDLGVRGIQFFELLEAAGPHAGLVEWAIIRQDMLLATGQENEHTEEQSARLHLSILAGGNVNAPDVCRRGYWCEGQVCCGGQKTRKSAAPPDGNEKLYSLWL